MRSDNNCWRSGATADRPAGFRALPPGGVRFNGVAIGSVAVRDRYSAAMTCGSLARS